MGSHRHKREKSTPMHYLVFINANVTQISLPLVLLSEFSL